MPSHDLDQEDDSTPAADLRLAVGTRERARSIASAAQCCTGQNCIQTLGAVCVGAGVFTLVTLPAAVIVALVRIQTRNSYIFALFYGVVLFVVAIAFGARMNATIFRENLFTRRLRARRSSDSSLNGGDGSFGFGGGPDYSTSADVVDLVEQQQLCCGTVRRHVLCCCGNAGRRGGGAANSERTSTNVLLLCSVLWIGVLTAAAVCCMVIGYSARHPTGGTRGVSVEEAAKEDKEKLAGGGSKNSTTASTAAVLIFGAGVSFCVYYCLWEVATSPAFSCDACCGKNVDSGAAASTPLCEASCTIPLGRYINFPGYRRQKRFALRACVGTVVAAIVGSVTSFMLRGNGDISDAASSNASVELSVAQAVIVSCSVCAVIGGVFGAVRHRAVVHIRKRRATVFADLGSGSGHRHRRSVDDGSNSDGGASSEDDDEYMYDDDPADVDDYSESEEDGPVGTQQLRESKGVAVNHRNDRDEELYM